MSDSYSASSWKVPFESMLTETDETKLTELVHATEAAMFRRWQELASSSDHHEERSEMDVASAALLSIKTHKLGWPGFYGK
ncbi:MAG: hypothetical protein WB607_28490 [Candidatus Acidiferrum sp.]|jgi:hypothetical protein